jgi:hypothetical protein
MRLVRFILVAAIAIALMILGSTLVAAQSQPQQYGGGGGGGMIKGTVLGFDMWDRLEPIAWAAVYANNGVRTFVAYSGSGGFYSMFVTAGVYNVTVTEPGYKTYSNSVVVSDGSVSSINFTLEQSHLPVPEFEPSMTFVVMVLTLAGVLVKRRRSTKHSG